MDISYGPDPDDLSDSDDSLYMYSSIREKPQLTEEQNQRNELNSFYDIIRSNSTEGLLHFLDKGFNVDTNLRDRWTPLLLSSSFGYFKLITILLEHGADINQRRDGITPLMLVCSCTAGNSDESDKIINIVKLLIENGADVKALNYQAKNALMFAAAAGNLNVVEYLLPLCNREALDNQGWNVLTWAVSSNHLDVVKYLMTQNVSIDIVDFRDLTVYDIAKQNNFKEILDLFPKRVEDITIDDLYCNILFEEEFDATLNPKPILQNEIVNILYSINCDYLLPIFKENKINLEEFLCLTNEEMQQMGVKMPIQRYKILEALHTFHVRPYTLKSLHICLDNKAFFSNRDAAIQLTSAVYQLTTMNGAIKFIIKNLEEFSEEEKQNIIEALKSIKQHIQAIEHLNNRLNERICNWDELAKCPDLITKDSLTSKYSWTKIAISCGMLAGLALLIGPKYIFCK